MSEEKKFYLSDVINATGMTKVVWIVFILTCLGMFFDGYDYMMVAYTMPTLGAEWELSPVMRGSMQSWSTIGVVVGAAIGGIISDKFGRRKAFLLAVGWYTLFTVPTAFAPDFTWFAILRVLAGVGMGSFYPISAVIVAEVAPVKLRAPMMTISGAFNVIGWVVVGLLATSISGSFGWRGVYFSGAVAVLLFIAALIWLPESMAWQVANGKEDQACATLRKSIANVKGSPFKPEDIIPENLIIAPKPPAAGVKALFVNGQAKKTIPLWICAFCCFFTVFGLTTWLPSLLVDKGFELTTSFAYSIANNAAGIAACFLIGPILEKFGRRKGIIIAALCSLVAIALMAFINGGTEVMFVFIILLGLCMNMLPPSIMPICSELYPTSSRNTGQSWMQAVGRSAAIFSPIISGALVAGGIGFQGLFMFYMIPSVILLVIVAVFFRKETKGANIEDIKLGSDA